MKRVWIVQCLCPHRHCILAAANEVEDVAGATELMDELHGAVDGLVADGTLNPWCGICHAKQDTWTYDIGRTRYTTLTDAAPLLLELEAKQAAVRAAWGDMKRSD